MAVKGLDGILKNIAAAERTLSAARRTAFTRIGLIVKADAVKNAPVDTGNLRGSAFSEVQADKLVFVGFTAKYAPWVHENLEANFKKGGPRFLARSVEQNRSRILKELAKVKL